MKLFNQLKKPSNNSMCYCQATRRPLFHKACSWPKCIFRGAFNFLGSLLLLASLAFPSAGLASPIHDAALTGNVELMEILIANGADVDERDVNGYTPLHLAIQEGYADVAKTLIANGADVNARAVSSGENDVTPLYLSIILGRGGVETLLRSNGATGPQTPVNILPANPNQ